MGLLTEAHGRGLLSARPAAGHPAREYYATDTSTTYRDNGSSWDSQATSGYTAGGTDVPIADGGTGASSAATARSNLGALADTDAITYLDGTVAAAPATPAAGMLRIYAKTGDVLAVKDDAGNETVLGQGIADQGAFTFLDATEAAAPATPASGFARIYAKSDGRIYSMDDAGTEFGPFDAAGGGGGGTGYIAAIAAEANLLYYHPMNETSGTSFHDELGGTALAGTTGGNEVAVDGPPLQGDVLGGSVGFNSGFQKVSKAAITWPAQWTWEVWAFFLFNPANGIFGQWDGSGSMLFINGASDTRVYCGGSAPSWNATNAEIRGRHHILIGYDGTNVHLYWDGVEKINSACSNNSTNVGSNYQLGGVNGGGNGNGFVLSDSAFYDDFDSGRAAAHYALGHP